MKNIVLYVRVSTEEAAANMEGSLKSQEQRLREYVEERNRREEFGHIVTCFIEKGCSGKDTNRAELQKMFLGVKQGKYNLILVTEMSRISRSTRDFANMLEFFKKYNCQILSLREQYDTTTANGQMIMNMIMNFAQFERQQTAERIKNNYLARARRGLFGAGNTPLGYKMGEHNKGKLEIIPEEASVVKECFETFLKEGSLAPAAKNLNSRGFSPRKTALNSKKTFIRASYFTTDYLYRTLVNPTYIGLKRFQENGKEQITQAQWEPIIDKQIFKKAGELLKQNRCSYKPLHFKKHAYILTGLLSCAECGKKLSGKTAHGRNGKYFYYDHVGTLKKNHLENNPGCTCKLKRIKAKRIENAIAARLKEILLDKAYLNSLLKQAETNTNHSITKKDIHEQKRKIRENSRAQESLTAHLEHLPPNTKAQALYHRLNALEEQKMKFEGYLAELEKKLLSKVDVIAPEEYTAFLNQLVQDLETLPYEMTRRIFHNAIHKILVHEKKVEVFLHVGEYILEMDSSPECKISIEQGHLISIKQVHPISM